MMKQKKSPFEYNVLCEHEVKVDVIAELLKENDDEDDESKATSSSCSSCNGTR